MKKKMSTQYNKHMTQFYIQFSQTDYGDCQRENSKQDQWQNAQKPNQTQQYSNN